jgi:hypothetical protein
MGTVRAPAETAPLAMPLAVLAGCVRAISVQHADTPHSRIVRHVHMTETPSLKVR